LRITEVIKSTLGFCLVATKRLFRGFVLPTCPVLHKGRARTPLDTRQTRKFAENGLKSHPLPAGCDDSLRIPMVYIETIACRPVNRAASGRV
jgi:hypothetical protein